MKIAFRTDASISIGTGHFMRCLTLAVELKKKDFEVSFISRNLPPYLRDMLKKNGFVYVPLGVSGTHEPIDELLHSSWLGTSQHQDAKATVQALAGYFCDWLIVDHYALDERWEQAVRVCCKKLMVIDDLADRRHDCDMLLDQNYYVDMQARYSDKVTRDCNLLLGPNYSLLRGEFRVLRDTARVRIGGVKRILVFFGGVDAGNCTSLAIQVLAELGITLHVDVVIGAQHPFKEQIHNACIRYDYVCHVQTPRIAELMVSADLAIGAGGSASWERCCLGLPTLIVSIADNQVDIAESLDSIGACFYIGTAGVLSKVRLKKVITTILKMPDQILNVSKNAFALVDGVGASRVCREMEY